MFGLAAIAAVAAMAFVGASSATASGSTLLCEGNTVALDGTGAPACNSPAELHFVSVGKGTLLNKVLNVQCESLIKAVRTSAALANPVHFSGTLSYSNCTGGCLVKVITQGTILALKTGTELVNVTASGFVVNVNCFGFINCDYNATNLTGHGLGGGVAHVTYNENAVNIQEALSGFGCPETAKLDALFVSLNPLFIRQ